MNKNAKKRAIVKLFEFGEYFYNLRLNDMMSNDEFDWIRDHINSTISSIQNFEEINGHYDNFQEELTR